MRHLKDIGRLFDHTIPSRPPLLASKVPRGLKIRTFRTFTGSLKSKGVFVRIKPIRSVVG